MRLIFIFIFFIFSIFSIAQTTNKRPKVGVVLSGGGAKGYAHIGALKIIEEAGIKIDYIGGTSMGAIVGGLYASGYTPDQLEELIRNMDLNSLITKQKSRTDIPFFDKSYREKYLLELPFDNFRIGIPHAISTGQGPAETLDYLFRHVHHIKNFGELPTPFVCIGTNIETGEQKVFNSGNLSQAVLASGAYPSLIEPVIIDSVMYIDGGIVNNFPVEEVLKMGADIIIGVDLQKPLDTKDQIKSAAGILQQVISFRIVEMVESQRELTDILIKPDMTNYGVTSFDQIDPIIERGTEAAKSQFEELVKIAELQGFPDISRPSVADKEYVLITDLEVNGLNIFSESHIKGKIRVNPPQLVKFDNLRDDIKALYSSGNYTKIQYNIVPGEDGHNKLKIDVIEKPGKHFIKFGLHYDDIYKTGLLVNYTMKRLLFRNSVFSTDVVFGDNLRYSINYFIDNGYYPSFGINSVYRRFDRHMQVQDIFPDNVSLTELNYDFRWFYNQVYVQSTLFERYAIGGGIEHQYVDISTNSTNDNFINNIDKSYYMDLYGYLKADNRDNSNFPKRGFKFDGRIKHYYDSNYRDFQNYTQVEANLQTNFPINKYFTYRFFGKFGTFFNDPIPDSFQYVIGGYVEQEFINYSRFYGFPFGIAAGNTILVLGSSFQFHLPRNHYFTAHFNIANLENTFIDFKVISYDYLGYGISYGYDSALGPISFLWSYSPYTSKGLFNINLGFWF